MEVMETPIVISLPTALYDWVRDYAYKQETSVQEIVAEALEEFLTEKENE